MGLEGPGIAERVTLVELSPAVRAKNSLSQHRDTCFLLLRRSEMKSAVINSEVHESPL